MATKKAQSKAGIPAQRRGQQMGDERSSNNPNKMEESRATTPALRGRRKEANEFFADESMQEGGGNTAAPRTNSPSVAAAVPTNEKVGEPGGEAVQKAAVKAQGKGQKAKGKR